MKHLICTAAGRVTVERAIVLGRHVVAIRVSHLPGLPAFLPPPMFIEPAQAGLLAQAFDLVAEECAAAAPAKPVQAYADTNGLPPAGVTAPEKVAAAGAGMDWPAFPGEQARSA